jgi:hypothetical protein
MKKPGAGPGLDQKTRNPCGLRDTIKACRLWEMARPQPG